MLTGSTSTVTSLPIWSYQQPCRFLRSQALFARGNSTVVALPPRSRISISSCRSKSVLEERNEPRSHDTSATKFGRLLPCSIAPANVIPHLCRPTIPSGIPARPGDEDSDHPLVGTGSLSDTQARQQHGCVSSLQESHLDQTERKCSARRRRTLLWVMLTAKSPDRVWAAYQELLLYQVVISHHLLHRLARLLASIKPRTRTIHLQLLSTLKTLQRNHGKLRLWEWNTLIDSVGKQWHKTRLEDYENALDIFDKKGVLPMTHAVSVDEVVDTAAGSPVTRQDPDIWTYNILLSIASRSNSPLAVRHASSLLLASGLPPNRHTHLCLLRYFAIRKDLRSVRSTLRKMTEQGLQIGLDGINACLWAYARNGRFDITLCMYRVLRSNVEPVPDLGVRDNNNDDGDVNEDARYIFDTLGLDVPDGLVPDVITYTTMIQSLAYHGDLRNALGVFVDMLSTPNHEVSVARPHGVPLAPTRCYQPTMAAFRGLFLGFARHGRDSEHHGAEVGPAHLAELFPFSRASWDLDTLETVFTAFLQLPGHPKPTDRIIYWILVAFDKASGGDAAKLREVWIKLEAKYGGGWGGRLEDFRRSIFTSEDPKALDSYDN